MKIFILPQILSLLAVSFVTPCAHASTFDLVAYSENENTFLWRIEKSSTGVEMLVAYECPRDNVIDSKDQCSSVGQTTIPVTEFSSFVRATVVAFAKKNPGLAFDLFSSPEVKLILTHPRSSPQKTEFEKLKSELATVEAMLLVLPNSPKYLEVQAEKKKQIQAFAADENELSSVEIKLSDLSEGIISAIRFNNPETHQLNYFGKSQMQGKLLPEVLTSVLKQTGSDSRAFLRTVPHGKRYWLKIKQSGWADQLWDGETFVANYRDSNPKECAALEKIIRELQAKDQW